MPRQIDSSLLNARIANNPNVRISSASINNILNNWANIPEVTLKAIEDAINQLLGYIDQVTGLDLKAWAAQLEALFGPGNLLTGLMGVVTGLVPALIALFVDILTFNWAAVPADLAALTSLGVNGTSLSSALSKSVTSAPPVAFDSSSHDSINTGSPTSKTVPHTTAAAANTAMLVTVAIGPIAPTPYAQGFVSATYNGVPLHSEGGIDSGHGSDGWHEYFTLDGAAGPASGTHNVVVTTNAPVHSIVVDVETYTGCGGFSGFTKAATNSDTQTLTVAAQPGGIVVVAMASATPLAGVTGATQRSLQNVDNTTTAGNLVVGDAPGAATVTISATGS